MATVGSDTFTESTTNTDLPSHTPDVGATWAVEVASAFGVREVQDELAHANSALQRARKGDDIGDDEMDVTADCKVTNTNSRASGVCGRMSTDNYTNQYEAYIVRDGSSTEKFLKLFKHVSGVRTEIGSYTATLGGDTYATVKLSIRSGSQKVYLDGVERISTTELDSVLQNRQHAGVIMFGAGLNNTSTRIDNFLSESVAAAAGKPHLYYARQRAA